MQICLTSDTAKHIKLNVTKAPMDKTINPLFNWTAVIGEPVARKRPLFLMNQASRMVVIIQPLVSLKKIQLEVQVYEAIKATFESMGMNPEIVKSYFEAAGDFAICKNSGPSIGNNKSYYQIRSEYNYQHYYESVTNYYDNTLGVSSNCIVRNPDGKDKYVYTHDYLDSLLKQEFEMPVYQTHAYEFLVTLDLELYVAKRRLILPATNNLQDLHRAIMRAYSWEYNHLSMIELLDKQSGQHICDYTNYEDEGMKEAMAIKQNYLFNAPLKLLTYAKISAQLVYDYGDWWEHHIEFVREHEAFEHRMPYMAEIEGKRPPEDVGGVYGYLEVLDILADSNHPNYEAIKHWLNNQHWFPETSSYFSEIGPLY